MDVVVVKCWVVEQGLAAAGSCSGALVKAHLIPKQRIKREFPHGVPLNVLKPDPPLAPVVRRVSRLVARDYPDMVTEWLPLDRVVWDRRVWVPICGGPMGNAGHHGQLDSGGVNRLQIPREKLPHELEEFAAFFGLEWSLEADYGLRGALTNG